MCPFIFKVPVPFYSEILKSIASDGATGDFYGQSVAIDGNIAVIGARGSDSGSVSNSGGAYVFEYNGNDWLEVQKLTASDKNISDFLGMSVAINGTTIVVGALGDDPAGAAYVYEKGATWPSTETAKISPSDGASNDEFGGAVAINGTTIVVGSKQNDPAGGAGNAGAAYVYEKGATWPSTETQKLTASDKTVTVWFGGAVAIDGTTIVVGAIDGGSTDNGVYIFEKSGTWPSTETQKLTASDNTTYFGSSVAIEGTTIISGAYNSNQSGFSAAGSAYIFEKSGTWAETQKITAINKSVNARFGYCVSISGNTIIVGARDAETVYVFEKSTTWTETQFFTASDGVSGATFGQTCGISGFKFIVGAASADIPVTDIGAAYFFAR